MAGCCSSYRYAAATRALPCNHSTALPANTTHHPRPSEYPTNRKATAGPPLFPTTHHHPPQASKFLVAGRYELAIPGAIQAISFLKDIHGDGAMEVTYTF